MDDIFDLVRGIAAFVGCLAGAVALALWLSGLTA